MHLDDAFDECQTHARALSLRVELVEQVKDLIMEFRVNADAVVAQEQDGLAVRFRCVAEPDCP